MSMGPKWLEYAKKLQSIAQAGLAYSTNKYDRERFEQIRDISIDIIHTYTEMDHEKIRTLFANENGYQTPKIDVRAAIFRGGKILMVKEQIDGMWALPGGWADVDCSLMENVVKEAKEEAGADVKPKRVIAIYDRTKNAVCPMPYAIYKIFVECEYLGGQFEKNIETSAAGFFSLDDLPPLSVNRNSRDDIKLCFEVKGKKFHETIFN